MAKKKKQKMRSSKMIKTSKTQTGTSNKKSDSRQKAMQPGTRETIWGTRYTEKRKNRTDKKGSKT